MKKEMQEAAFLVNVAGGMAGVRDTPAVTLTFKTRSDMAIFAMGLKASMSPLDLVSSSAMAEFERGEFSFEGVDFRLRTIERQAVHGMRDIDTIMEDVSKLLRWPHNTPPLPPVGAEPYERLLREIHSVWKGTGA